MPRYARRAQVGPASPRAPRRADDGRHRDEREVALLAGQLRALGRDISRARSSASTATTGVALLRGRHADVLRPRMRGERLSLPDGAEIRIRPIEPEDATELEAGFRRLTAVSRYGRFLGGVDRLTPRQLEYLAAVDHVDHEALAAFDADTGMGIGVARYVRDAHDPSLAEVAVVVADEWQGRRVGTALLERLGDRAYSAGVERLVGRLIVGNKAARALAAHVGAPLRESRGAGTLELTVRLGPR